MFVQLCYQDTQSPQMHFSAGGRPFAPWNMTLQTKIWHKIVLISTAVTSEFPDKNDLSLAETRLDVKPMVI